MSQGHPAHFIIYIFQFIHLSFPAFVISIPFQNDCVSMSHTAISQIFIYFRLLISIIQGDCVSKGHSAISQISFKSVTCELFQTFDKYNSV